MVSTGGHSGGLQNREPGDEAEGNRAPYPGGVALIPVVVEDNFQRESQMETGGIGPCDGTEFCVREALEDFGICRGAKSWGQNRQVPGLMEQVTRVLQLIGIPGENAAIDPDSGKERVGRKFGFQSGQPDSAQEVDYALNHFDSMGIHGVERIGRRIPESERVGTSTRIPRSLSQVRWFVDLNAATVGVRKFSANSSVTKRTDTGDGGAEVGDAEGESAYDEKG